MKLIAVGLVVLALIASSSPAVADDAAPVDVDAASQESVDAQAVNDPFAMVDPSTGQAVSPDTVLTLPNGKTMKASEYYGVLNGYQAELNQHGHTLKGQGDVGTVVRTIKNVQELQQKKDEQAARSTDKDPAIMEELLDPEALYKKARSAAEDRARDELRDLYVKAINSGVPVPLINGNRAQPRVVVKPNDQLKSLTYKEWTLDIVNAESFSVTGKATLQVDIDLKEVKGLADARAVAKVLGHDVKLLEGSVKAHGILTQPSTAEIQFAVAGKDLIHRTWTDPTILLKGTGQPEPQQQTIRESTKFRFTVGPVPMSGEVGAAGTVGYDWAASVTSSSGSLAAMAFVQADAFANVGADVEIAQAGVGGVLTLLNETLKIEGEMGFDLDKTTSEPTLTTSVNGTEQMSVLAGDLHVYVRAYVPTLAVPPYKEKEWSWEIFSWPGLALGDLTAPKVLFNFKRVVDRHGFSLTGAPTAEDYEDAQVDQALQVAMADTMRDLAGEGSKVLDAGDKSIGAMAAVRNDLDAWLGGLQ